MPRAVRTRSELFPGWGWPDIGAVAAGLLVGLMLQWLFGLIDHAHTSGFIGRIVLVVVSVAVATGAVRDPTGGGSPWRRAQDWQRYLRRPRRYLFRHGMGGPRIARHDQVALAPPPLLAGIGPPLGK